MQYLDGHAGLAVIVSQCRKTLRRRHQHITPQRPALTQH
jgi:hypothetical protein